MQRAPSSCRTVRAAVSASVGWLLIVGLSSTVEGAEKRAAPLARYFPARDLVVYAEFDGLDNHAALWKGTAAYKALNETTAGAMLESVIAQVFDRSFASVPRKPVTGIELVTLVEQAFQSGFALAINRAPGAARPTCVGLVLRGAARSAVRESWERLINAGNVPSSKIDTVDRPGGRKVTVVTDKQGVGVAWWEEGDDLAFSLVSPQGADVMIKTLDGGVPNAVSEPIRARLARAEWGFEPIGVAFFAADALPPLPPQTAALGLDGIRRAEYRWGVDGEALRTSFRVVAPAPRRGILGLFDQPVFDADGLPPLPRGLAAFSVFSLKPTRVLDTLLTQARAVNPSSRMQFDMLERRVQAVTGRRLREDILGHLGPKMTFTVVPTRTNAPTTVIEGFAKGFFSVAPATLLAEVDDADEFAKVLDDVAAGLNRAFRDRGANQPEMHHVEIRPLKKPDRGYYLSVPPAAAPLPAGMRPTILMGKAHVAFATTPDAARRAVALEDQPGGLPAGDVLASGLERLPKSMTVLAVGDERQSLVPEVVANLPTLIQLAGSRTGGGGGPLFRRFLTPRGPNAFTLNLDPDLIPSPEQLRAKLFPASYALSVDNDGIEFVSREALPALNPTTLAPVALAMLLPAIQASRSAAQRSQSVNNLKMMGLALHNFLSANNHFPPVATTDKNGKPLLSWRVAILPFIEQQALFNEFHQDEPWDSPHNKTLIERMPTVYAVPGTTADPGHTFYRSVSGKGTIFDPTVKEGVRIADVTDGTSNTIAIVEAREAVPWTKPDAELPFNADLKPEDFAKDDLLSKLGGHFPGGFNALITDGSVRFLKESINRVVLRALMTRNGGEVISSDSF